MKSFRAYWNEEAADTIDAAPRLRTVSSVAPTRPRWGHLYLGMATIGAIGTAAHFAVNDSVLLEVVDVVFAFALFAWLAGWVRFNRISLSRLDEPDAGEVVRSCA